jgi:hypothetical protein
MFCEQTPSEEQRSFKSVYSMMPIIQNQYPYIKRRQVKTEWGVSRREGEREREKQIKGGRETELRRESKMAWVEK